MRGKHERVGLGIKLCQMLRRHRAEHGNAFFQCVTCDIGIKPCRGIAIARAVAGNRQQPWQVGERRQRSNQHVKTLARHHGADRQQPHDTVPAALRQRCRIAAWPRHRNALRWHAVIGSDQPCRGCAGDDDALHG